MTEERIRAATVGELRPNAGPVELADYDAGWPRLFRREARRIRRALDDGAVAIEHVGSTAVPGLAAKPIIDILLIVADSAEEASYAPSLESAGYVLRIREPDWHEHRMFVRPDSGVHLHVFSPDSGETTRMIAFRDHLRTSDADRRRYEDVKRRLARRTWRHVQDYADAKSEVVEEILARAT